MTDEARRIQSCIDHVKSAVDVDPWAKELCESIMTKYLKGSPGSDSKGGKWTDKDVFSIKETTIEEMQSAKCSKCGKIHTTPYMYYFFKYDFCPCCGERMEE